MKAILILICLACLPKLYSQTKEKMQYKFYLDSAHYYFEEGNYEKCIDFSTEAIHTIPDVPFAYGMRAICYSRLERHLEAIHDYTKAIEYPPQIKSSELYYSRAISEIMECDTNACLTDLNKCLDLDYKNADAFFSRARIFVAKNNIRRAMLDLSQCLSIDSTYFDAAILKADLLARDSNLREAYKFYKKASMIRPEVAYNHYQMGLIQLEENNLGPCLKHFNETIQCDTGQIKQFNMVYFMRGNVYRELGDNERSLSDFQTYNGFYPDDAIGFYATARAKIRLKKQKEALPDLNRSIELDNTDEEVYYWRGLLKFWLEMDGCSDLIKAEEMGYEDATLEIKNRSCR